MGWRVLGYRDRPVSWLVVADDAVFRNQGGVALALLIQVLQSTHADMRK